MVFFVYGYNEAKTTANTGYLQAFKITTSCHVKFMPNMPFGGGFVSVKDIPQQQLSTSRRVRSAKTRSVSPPFLCLCAWRPLINIEEIHPGMVRL